MPGGKRTDRISVRDLEVLEFVVRFGCVPRRLVALWAGTGRAVTYEREARLRAAGLVEVLPGVGDSGRLLLGTREGQRAVFRGELPLPRFSAGRILHSAVNANVAIQLEAAGQKVLSEREIFARERAEGERVFSAEGRPGRFHRPDLILLSDPPEAIEVELTNKGASRLDALLRAWRYSIVERKVGSVRYLCRPPRYADLLPERRSAGGDRPDEIGIIKAQPGKRGRCPGAGSDLAWRPLVWSWRAPVP